MTLIDADALRQDMYHEAFETDSEMQKWDCGCWIRYKMFEQQIDKQPTVDAVSVVRCKDCIYWNERETNKKGFVVCKATHMDCVEDDYCSFGERVTE